jgi:hypothetical protein
VIDVSKRLLDLPTITDPRGHLTFVEGLRHVPFDIKRVYYLHHVPAGAERGGHAHHALHQVLIAVSGGFTVVLDDGHGQVRHRLDDARKGLLIKTMEWRELVDFTPGGVCLVLASRPYEESDYIRDYDTFLRAVGAKA